MTDPNRAPGPWPGTPRSVPSSSAPLEGAANAEGSYVAGPDIESEADPEDVEEDADVDTSDDDPASDDGGPAESPFVVLPAPLRAALEARGFTSFTAVQSAVLDALGAGADLRISSQTGSGKTVALGFAMAEDVLDAEPSEASAHARSPYAVARPTRTQRGPVALVIVPTRELAAQVAEELSWLYAEVEGASVDVVTGGTSVPFERRRLARSPRVLVGTPGRLVDHLESGALKLDGVRQLVLDEADQMLDMGFREELEAILERTPPERRTHLVSATFPEAIQRLAERYQRSPRTVEGTRLGAVNADIEHVAHLVRPDQRYALLVNLLLLSGGERTLVFVNTRAETGELSARLAEDGFGAQPLSGELQQAQRTRTLAAFRAGAMPVLVATDVAARGLDVPDVALVVHTALPIDGETYVHRSGRTGRAGQRGRSVLMVTPSRERKAGWVLGDAGVTIDWRQVPSAEEVQAVLDSRARARLAARLEAAASAEAGPSPGTLALARELLVGRDPALVVAALLPNAVEAHPATPRDLFDAPLPRALMDRRRTSAAKSDRRPPIHAFGGRPSPVAREGFLRGDDRRAPDDRGTDVRGPDSRSMGERGLGPDRGPERAADAPRSGARRGSSGFVRFRVNWGFRGGANPRRLLATLCRRGGVSSREIGSIDIGPSGSTFEVADYAAAGFAERAMRDDPRDPGLWVAPDAPPREPTREAYRGPRRM